MLFSFASTNLEYTAHLNAHSPLHMHGEKKKIPPCLPFNCSQLSSDFKALCEACRLSEVQVRSGDSSNLTFFTLSFCLESILKMFTSYISVFFPVFPLHTVLYTQPCAYTAYLRNKLWTIETSNLVRFLPRIYS